MTGFRNLSEQETIRLAELGNRADDWRKVVVADDFTPDTISGCRFRGNVRIGSRVVIEDSAIENYEIGDGTLIRSVTALECRHRSAFGNGTRVDTVNENGGRSIVIFDRISAQYAYMAAMYRHRPQLVERLDSIAAEYADSKSADMGHIGRNCRIVGAKFIRETNIGDTVTIDGASLLENGTILDGAKIGVDVKAKDFIAAENSTLDLGATCRRCFIGESAIVANGFTTENSLFFANSHCENGEAAAIFAGPYTVSHHKSTLLIAGMFSFFNAGSGTNQSNHLFKGGPVHQSVHRRGCKFASNAYVMSPAAEGAYTMIMGRHTKHHDTSKMPFSYLVESNGTSLLMPAMNLRSYGTLRDIEKWCKRDRRTVRRDIIDFEEYNPYVTSMAIEAMKILQRLHDEHPDESVYHYRNTAIKSPMLRLGLKLYDKYIICALGDMLSRGCDGNCDGSGDWADIAGQYVSRRATDRLIAGIENGEIASAEMIDEYLRDFDSRYDDYARSWALAALAERLGYTPTDEDIAAIVEAGRLARISMREAAEADLAKENSADMSVGYGTDCTTDEERTDDFRTVRGLV